MLSVRKAIVFCCLFSLLSFMRHQFSNLCTKQATMMLSVDCKQTLYFNNNGLFINEIARVIKLPLLMFKLSSRRRRRRWWSLFCSSRHDTHIFQWETWTKSGRCKNQLVELGGKRRRKKNRIAFELKAKAMVYSHAMGASIANKHFGFRNGHLTQFHSRNVNQMSAWTQLSSFIVNWTVFVCILNGFMGGLEAHKHPI